MFELRTTLVYIVISMTQSALRYQEFYATCDQPPLYAAPWWLDAACGKEMWDATPLINENSAITGFIPFYKTQIRGLPALITPPMTQWIPVLTKEDPGPFSITDFLNSLPTCPILDITMKPGVDDDLPSRDYQLNYKYSYVVPYEKQSDQIRGRYNEGLRRNLRDAEINYTLGPSEDTRSLLLLCKSAYRLRKEKAPYWLDQIIPAVADALKKNNSGNIHFAFHRGVVIAGVLCGWDSKTTYYLAGGRSSDEQGASAHALLLDYVIHEAQKRGHAFDFEGSMHPGIANFFQSFGGKPESYLQIRRFKGPGRIWSLFH